MKKIVSLLSILTIILGAAVAGQATSIIFNQPLSLVNGLGVLSTSGDQQQVAEPFGIISPGTDITDVSWYGFFDEKAGTVLELSCIDSIIAVSVGTGLLHEISKETKGVLYAE